MPLSDSKKRTKEAELDSSSGEDEDNAPAPAKSVPKKAWKPIDPKRQKPTKKTTKADEEDPKMDVVDSIAPAPAPAPAPASNTSLSKSDVSEDEDGDDDAFMAAVERAKAARVRRNTNEMIRPPVIFNQNADEVKGPTVSGYVVSCRAMAGASLRVNGFRLQLLTSSVNAAASQITIQPTSTDENPQGTVCHVDALLWPVVKCAPKADEKARAKPSGGMVRKDRVMQPNPDFDVFGAILTISCTIANQSDVPIVGDHVTVHALEASINANQEVVYYDSPLAPIIANGRQLPSERLKAFFEAATYNPSIARAIYHSTVTSLGGIECMSDGSCGDEALGLYQAERRQAALGRARALIDLAGDPKDPQNPGTIPPKEDQRDDKRERALLFAKSLEDEDLWKSALSIVPSAKNPSVVLLNTGLPPCNGYDARSWDMICAQGGRKQRQLVKTPTPHTFVDHSFAGPPTSTNEESKLYTIGVISRCVPNAPRAAKGELGKHPTDGTPVDPDPSGTIIARKKNATGQDASLDIEPMHVAKLMISAVSASIGMRSRKHLDAFTKSRKWTALPQVYVVPPSAPRRTDSAELPEQCFTDAYIHDIPSLLRKEGILVSGKWALQNVATSTYYKPIEKLDEKKYAVLLDTQYPQTTFPKNGFVNLLENIITPDELQATLPKSIPGAVVNYYVLMLDDGEVPASVGRTSTEDGERYIESVLGGSAGNGPVSPAVVRNYFCDGKAVIYAVMGHNTSPPADVAA